MHTIKLIALVALSIATGAAAASAQGPAAGGAASPTSLQSLLDAAMRENPGLRAAEASYAAARERVSPAGALPDPMVMFSAEGTPIRTPSPTNAEMGKITLTQMIHFPGKRGLMRSAMAEEAEMARAQLERRRLEVAADLHGAYYDLGRIHESIDLLLEARATMEMFASIARARYATGSAQQMDMLKASVELAQESSKLAIMRAELPAAIARVNIIVGRSPDAPIDRPVLPDSIPDLPAIDLLEARTTELQPMLKMKDREVRRSDFALRLARRERFPDFTVGVEYMNVKEMPDSWMGMAGINLPIWRGSKLGPNRRSAEQALAAARAGRSQTENEVRLMTRESLAMAVAARETLSLYRDSVLPQAEASLASSKAAYETGRAGFLDLLEAQRMLLDSRMGFAEAKAEYLKGRATLGLAVGDPEMLGVSHE